MKSVLFVCLGNICRSPTAEGVFRHQCEQLGLADQIQIDSAGTAGWHVGKPPDARGVAAAANRGIDISGLRGRQVTPADFYDFDLILAMDSANLNDLEILKPADSEAEYIGFCISPDPICHWMFQTPITGATMALTMCSTLSNTHLEDLSRI